MPAKTLQSFLVLAALVALASCRWTKLDPTMLSLPPGDPGTTGDQDQANTNWSLDDQRCSAVSSTIANGPNLSVIWEGLSTSDGKAIHCELGGTVHFAPGVYPRSLSMQARGSASAAGGTFAGEGAVGLASPDQPLARVEHPTADDELTLERHADLRGARSVFCRKTQARTLSWAWTFDLSLGRDELGTLDSFDLVFHLGHCDSPDYELMCPWLRSAFGQLVRLPNAGIIDDELKFALALAFSFDANDLRSNCVGEQLQPRPGDLELLHETAWKVVVTNAEQLRPQLEAWCDAAQTGTDLLSGVDERKCLAQAALARLGDKRDCGCP